MKVLRKVKEFFTGKKTDIETSSYGYTVGKVYKVKVNNRITKYKRMPLTYIEKIAGKEVHYFNGGDRVDDKGVNYFSKGTAFNVERIIKEVL